MKHFVKVFALNLFELVKIQFSYFEGWGVSWDEWNAWLPAVVHPEVGKSITPYTDPQVISVFRLLSHSQFIWPWVWTLGINSRDLASSLLYLRSNFWFLICIFRNFLQCICIIIQLKQTKWLSLSFGANSQVQQSTFSVTSLPRGSAYTWPACPPRSMADIDNNHTHWPDAPPHQNPSNTAPQAATDDLSELWEKTLFATPRCDNDSLCLLL